MDRGKKFLKAAGYISFTGLLASVGAALDFGMTFLYSLIPEANDGIVGPSFLMCLFWGEDGWTRLGYFEVFRGAVLVAFALLLVTLLLFTLRANQPKQK